MIKAWRQAGLLGELGLEDFEGVLHLFEYFMNLRQKFHSSRFYGNLHLFVATDSVAPTSPDVWTPYIDGKLLTYQMSCRHSEMTNLLEIGINGRTIAKHLHEMDDSRNYDAGMGIGFGCK